MILFVGNQIKLGGLAEVVMTRKEDRVDFLPEHFDIKRQENDILKAAKDADHIIYDCREYYNDGLEIADIIKRIYRTNKATPILLVDTDNPNNEIVKACVAKQIKNFINASVSLGMQKDQLEKCLMGYYYHNVREDLQAAEEMVQEETRTVSDFVQTLYDAKQREEEKERTIIINKKGNTEVAVEATKAFLRVSFAIVSIILMSLAIIALIYKEPRTALFRVLIEIYMGIVKML